MNEIEEESENRSLLSSNAGAFNGGPHEEVVPAPPSNRVGIACFFILGAGMLAPYNAFLTGIDYFDAIYGPHMDRLFTVCYLPMFLLMVCLMIHMGPETTNSHTRITAGFSAFVALTALVPVVDALLIGEGPREGGSSSEASGWALVLLLGTVLAVGICDGVCQGAVLVNASNAGPKYIQATVGGTALSGVLICLLRIITKPKGHPGTQLPSSSSPGGGGGLTAADLVVIDELRTSAALYFSLAATLSALGLLAHLVILPRLHDVRRPRYPGHKQRLDDERGNGMEGEERLPVSLPAAGGDEEDPPPPSSFSNRRHRSGVGPSARSGSASLKKSDKAREKKKKKRGDGLARPSLQPAFVLGDEDEEEEGGGEEEQRTLNQAVAEGDAAAPPPPPHHGAHGGGGGDMDEKEEEEEDYEEPVTEEALFGHHQPRAGHQRQQRTGAAALGSHHPRRMGSNQWLPQNQGLLREQGEGERWIELKKEAEANRRANRRRYVRIVLVVRRIWPTMGSLFLIYAATLSIFPGVLAEDVHSVELGSWYAILLITTYNVADAAGKLSPIKMDMWTNRQALLLLASGVRALILVPSLVLAARAAAPVGVMVLLTVILGLTNGYLTTLCMTMAPSFTSVAYHRHRQGSARSSSPTSYSPAASLLGGSGPPGRASGEWGGGDLELAPPSSHPPPKGKRTPPHPKEGVDVYSKILAQVRAPPSNSPGPSSFLGSSPLFSQQTLGDADSQLQGEEEGDLEEEAEQPAGLGGRDVDDPISSSSISPRIPRRPKVAAVSLVSLLTEGDARDLAEDLCVVALAGGLTTGALLGWVWLLFEVPAGSSV